MPHSHRGPVPCGSCRLCAGDRGLRGRMPERGADWGASGILGETSSGEPQWVLALLRGMPAIHCVVWGIRG